MFPIVKTLSSFKKAKLYKLIIFAGIISFITVLLFVFAGTWLSTHFIHVEKNWLNYTIDLFTGLAFGLAGWFMLPLFTVIIAGLFQEKTIQNLNTYYYPDAPKKEGSSFWSDIQHDVRFTILALSLNILILPLFLIGIGFIVSILLNSYLLGREFFEGAAACYIGKNEAKKLRIQHKRTAFTGGFVITVLTLIPFVNLFIPIIAIVWMVHVYHGMSQTP
jgi:CysZ protein